MVAPPINNVPASLRPRTPTQTRFGIGGNQDPNTVYVGDLFKGSAIGGKSFYNYDVVADNWSMLSPEAIQKVATDAQDYAGWSKPVPKQNLPGFWATLVDIAYKANTQYGETISPIEAYGWYKKKFGKSLNSASGGSGGGGGSSAPNQRVNLTDPDTANQLVDRALETYLGRRANDKEQDLFRKALNRQEMNNPVSTDVQGNTAVSKGGINPAARAEKFAMAQEGSAEYQASTTLLDAFIDGIRNPVGGM